MTPDEIRADMASRQKQLDALAATQKERAQELAEALRTDAQKPLADMTIAEVYQEHNAISNRLFGPSGNGASWNACYMQALHELVQRALAEGEARTHKLAPEPAPDPKVEDTRVQAAVWAGDLAPLLRKSLEEMANFASVDMTLWNRHSNQCLQAITYLEIFAALDAVRAERRAKAQVLRVQAMRQEIRRMLDALHAGAWMDVPKLADDFLAAADAAEARDG